MRIVNLIENMEGKAGFQTEHGLSFYVETEKHRILIDTGASEKIIHNAAIAKIDLSEIDLIFLSHGHYDHADGLPYVMKYCPNATVYVQQGAFGAYYSLKSGRLRYIGVSEAVKVIPQIHFVRGNLVIDQEITVFAGMRANRLRPTTNSNMKVLKKDFEQDDFSHEQCILITEQGRSVLFSGCAHSGILNIMDRCEKVTQCIPSIVISGFHMMRTDGLSDADQKNARVIAEELKKYKTTFYTCHCTGEEAYRLMKDIMENQLQYIHCGEEIVCL